MVELAEEGVRPGVCASARMLMVGFAEKMPTENAAARASAVGRLRRLIGEQRTCPLPLPCHSTEKLSKEGKETGDGTGRTRGVMA